MELLDVFTDIETPQTSEDEEDVPVQFPSPSTTKAKTMYNKILHAPMMPSRPTAYDERYLDAKYRKNVSKKYKKMMKKAKSVDFQSIYDNPRFWLQIDRVAQTYADHGGRDSLYELVALYCHLTSDENVDVSDSESESEEKVNSDVPPSNKIRFHENDDDDDDDNDNNGNQLVGGNMVGPIIPV